jgi:hypothetical protein
VVLPHRVVVSFAVTRARAPSSIPTPESLPRTGIEEPKKTHPGLANQIYGLVAFFMVIFIN